MEGANEAGRKAANAIIERSGAESLARLFTLYQPQEFALAYANDDLRYSLGLPNAFDIIDPHWP